ncbi:hypothetical protein HIO71_12295 [Chryseobacterium aquaticum]|uniref:Novel STAND NTPase 5 domain-containing protein n=1 Tax=Chryseobacterium aquaticum TaxID=452084 RepID=A0A848N1K8_9FLAO|nr:MULTISPECIES: hypothetical protein [Chryseobacterium]NMR34967.1 hypothetical protein [Chryseobacterium aquaticum]NRQ47169.1 hypothetical protein [Chryseobacterium sp. C-204]
MELTSIREKVKAECERCFDTKSLDSINDSKLRKYVSDTVKKNIEDIYSKFNDTLKYKKGKEEIQDYINSVIEGFVSKKFKDLFENGIIGYDKQRDEIKNTSKIDQRTVRKFVNINSDIDANPKTLDFFSVFLKAYGWNKLKDSLKRQQKLDSTNSIIPIIDIPQSEPSSVKRLEIPGATLIDEEFIEGIKTQSFSMAEFYTAMYNDDCQWFGVMKGWDIERMIYPNLKKIVISDFNVKKTYKISAILYGNGGTGKTTILRKMAVELAKESFTTLWIDNSKIQVFLEHSVPLIENTPNENYLLIIEDWYKAFHLSDVKEESFLIKIESLPNVRLVLADRHIQGKAYNKYINNPEHRFLVGSNENKKIISKIIENVPKWKKSCKFLDKNENNYKSSLYLLLFVIARDFDWDLDLSEPETAFENIVKSDMEFIYKQAPGIAKALYYFANIYRRRTLHISYESFLKISDYYQKKEKISPYFFDWEITNNDVINKLKLYIHLYPSDNLLLFNHDILNKALANACLEDWEKYNETTNHKILSILMKNGDAKSVSSLASAVISDLKSKERRSHQNLTSKNIYISKCMDILTELISKKNIYFNYELRIYHLQLSEENYKFVMEKFWKHKFFPKSFWEFFLEYKRNLELKKDYIEKILNYKKTDIIHPSILKLCLQDDLRGENQNNFYVHLLSNSKWKCFDENLIYCAFKYCKEEVIKKEVVLEILKDPWDSTIKDGIALVALTYNKDSHLTKEYTSAFLSNLQWHTRHHDLIVKCIYLCSDQSIIDNLIKKIVNDCLWNTIHKDIIFQLLKTSNNPFFFRFLMIIWRNVNYEILAFILQYMLKEDSKEKFYRKILSKFDIEKHELNIQALKEIKDKSVRQTFISQFFTLDLWKGNQQKALDILQSVPDISPKLIKTMINEIKASEKEYNKELLIYLLNVSKDQMFALHLLKDWKKKPWMIVKSCLAIFSSVVPLPKVVNEVIEKYIPGFDLYTSYFFLFEEYFDIIRLNFTGNTTWENELNRIYTQYESIMNNNRNADMLFSRILHYHRISPKKIKPFCMYILNNWENREILHPLNPKIIDIKKWKLKDILIIALGHPDLKYEANITALKIKYSTSDKIYKYYQTIINDIIFNGIYPEWEI